MIKKDLFDSNAGLYILSCLMRQPLLLQNDKYSFIKTDFYKPLHQIIFYAIYNMAQNGVERITPQDIDLYIQQYDAQYEYFKLNQGYNVVLQCYQLTEGSDLRQFDIYYNRVKKFSVLRDLESAGIDTSRFYDTEKDALNKDLEDEKLNRTSIQEILNAVRGNVAEIESLHVGKDLNKSQDASAGMRSLVQELQERPEVGLPLDGDSINWAARGARKGKLYMYSAPSGAGKALPNSTIIPTPSGLRTVGSIRVGDMLYDRVGRPTKVLRVFPQGQKSVWKITFADGREALCNDEHLWSVYKDDGAEMETLTLKEIIWYGYKHYAVPLCEAVQYQDGQDVAARAEIFNQFFGDRLEYRNADYLFMKRLRSLCWGLGKFARLRQIDQEYELSVNNNVTRNQIINVEYMYIEEEMTCFLVDNEEHLFLMNDFIVTHNTRFMVGNACAISMPYLDNHGDVIMRDDYQKVLFVATEMQADEIQTLILAYVSGVNEKSIVLGHYTPEELDRVKKALDIIDVYGSNFIIECIPDPSIAMIKARLIKYILQEDIYYIFYDYIFSSPGLLSEFRDIAVREDVALMMLSNSLKEIAMEYGVFIQSATQLNDGWAKRETGLRDQNCIRGSKAIADKIDIGLIGVRLNEEESKQINAIWSQIKLKHPEFTHDPNIVIDIYKNRRGELNCVKIFRYFDYATCRCEDLFITDATYKGVEVNKLSYQTYKYDFLDLKSRGFVRNE